jgi:hypothetical protein
MVDVSEKLSRPVLDSLTGFVSVLSGTLRDTFAPPRLGSLERSFMADKELCQETVVSSSLDTRLQIR